MIAFLFAIKKATNVPEKAYVVENQRLKGWHFCFYNTLCAMLSANRTWQCNSLKKILKNYKGLVTALQSLCNIYIKP